MFNFPIRLPLVVSGALMVLVVGSAFALTAAVQLALPFADAVIPLLAFVAVLVMAPVVFPEIRSFVRSGAGTFAWLAASAVLFCLTPAITFAQEVGESLPVFDIGSIFTSTASLAAFVIVIVQFIRAQIWKTLDGNALVGVVFVTGIGLALVGFYVKLLPATDVFAAIAFGLAAAVTAIGAVNLYKAKQAQKTTLTE
jgi:hypothetical protein